LPSETFDIRILRIYNIIKHCSKERPYNDLWATYQNISFKFSAFIISEQAWGHKLVGWSFARTRMSRSFLCLSSSIWRNRTQLRLCRFPITRFFQLWLAKLGFIPWRWRAAARVRRKSRFVRAEKCSRRPWTPSSVHRTARLMCVVAVKSHKNYIFSILSIWFEFETRLKILLSIPP
jgi:hypothetical protein